MPKDYIFSMNKSFDFSVLCHSNTSRKASTETETESAKDSPAGIHIELIQLRCTEKLILHFFWFRKQLIGIYFSWLQDIYLMNMKNIPRIDKINDAKSHIVKFSFKISKVNKMAQMVLDPDLAATAASGNINENALNNNFKSLYHGAPDWLSPTETTDLREDATGSNRIK